MIQLRNHSVPTLQSLAWLWLGSLLVDLSGQKFAIVMLENYRGGRVTASGYSFRVAGMPKVDSGRVCAACGWADNASHARFCGQCARSLDAMPPAGATLRAVTVLFVDVCNYTALTHRLGAERMYPLLAPCLRHMADTVQRFAGSVHAWTGDGVIAVFGIAPTLEAHAIHAADAALALVAEVAAYNASSTENNAVQFHIRVGLASGNVMAGPLDVARPGDMILVGAAINLAAWLQHTADPNTIMVHGETVPLLAPQFEFEVAHTMFLKGYNSPLEAAMLHRKRDSPSHSLPLVGRTEELRQIEESTLSLEGGMGGVIWLSGAAGVGKTRLIDEVLQCIGARAITVYHGECCSTTRNVPYSAMLSVVRELCGIAPSDGSALVREKISATVQHSPNSASYNVVPYLEYVLSIDLVDPRFLEQVQHFNPAQLKEQVFAAVREMLTAQAEQQPLLLVLDDLQWADDLSLELMAYLADALDTTPFLLLLMSRNNHAEPVQSLMSTVLAKAKHRAFHLTIDRLSDAALAEMAQTMLPHSTTAVINRVTALAQGMPFHLEQLARYAIEVGFDEPNQPDDAAQLHTIPASLMGLMQARYQRLPDSLALMLGRAAVIGRRFSRRLLAELRPADTLNNDLQQLFERGFIRPIRGSDDHWIFGHGLMQETVYNNLAAAQRDTMHADTGLVLERQAGERIDEQVDILAFHFARSPHIAKAIQYTLRSAERAADRNANDDALRLYDAADRLLPTDADEWQTERIALYRGRGDVLSLTGHYERARIAYQTALAVGETASNGIVAARLLRHLAATHEKQGQYDEASVVLDRARITLGDGGLIEHARIDADAGWIDFFRGDLDHAERRLRTALAVAEGEHHHSLQALVANRLAGVCWQRGDVPSAQHLVAQSLAMSRCLNDQLAVAKALNNLGVLAYEQSAWATAEAYYSQSMQTYCDLGDISGQIRTALNGTNATIMRGRLDDAFRAAHMTYSLAKQTNEHVSLVMSRFQQGTISFFVGDYAHARRYLIEAECFCRPLKSHHDKRALILELLSRVAIKRQKFDLALHLIRRAMHFAQLSQDASTVFRAKLGLVVVHSFRQECDRADELLAELCQNDVLPKNKYQRALLTLVQSIHAQHCGKLREARELQLQAEQAFAQIDVPRIIQRIV